jgi:ketosteroid isomerase-like protein
MKTCLVVALLSSLALCYSAHAQIKDPLEGKFDAACNSNDATSAATVAALFTDDAVFVTPYGVLHGREAIQKQFADWWGGSRARNHVSKGDPNAKPIAALDPKIVALNGEWAETGQSKDGTPYQIKGYWSAIDVQEGDVWKIRWLTYNQTPAPAPAETK